MKKNIFILSNRCPLSDARLIKQAFVLKKNKFNVFLFAYKKNGNEKIKFKDIEINYFNKKSLLNLQLKNISSFKQIVPQTYELIKKYCVILLTDKKIKSINNLEKKIELLVEQKKKLLKKIIENKKTINNLVKKKELLVEKKRVVKDKIIKKISIFIFFSLQIINTILKYILAKHTERLKKKINTINNSKYILGKDIEGLKDFFLENKITYRKIEFYTKQIMFAMNLRKINLNGISPDIIHCHNLETLLGGVALAEKYNAKVIYDAHEMETERAPPMTYQEKKFIKNLEQDLLKKTSLLISVSDNILQFYKKKYSLERTALILNSPKLSCHSSNINLHKFAKISSKKKIIVYTGIITATNGRGLYTLSEALKYLPDYELLIIGPRHHKNDNSLSDVAKIHGTQQQIHFFPSVKHDKVVSFIKSANVGVCLIQDITLSYRYSLPNKLFEYISANVPVCVSDLPEMSKIVKELRIGIVVNQTDPKAIASAIIKICKNKKSYKLNEKTLSIFKEKYSWSAQEKNLLREYSDLLATK